MTQLHRDWRSGATLRLAMDRSARSFDVNGNLHVAVANISKAMVCPYFGSEIPDADRLGLQQNRTYMLLRDPDELRKAAPTFNRLPVLSTHTILNADDHQHEVVVGAIGSDVTWNAPYLQASMTIWDSEDIAAIESGARKELSCAYRYRADMRSGVYQGQRYDGVMRDLIGNHVALVPEGRAGADVVVGDAAMPKTYPELQPEQYKGGIMDASNLDQGEQVQALCEQMKGYGWDDELVASLEAAMVRGLSDPNVATDAALRGHLARGAAKRSAALDVLVPNMARLKPGHR